MKPSEKPLISRSSELKESNTTISWWIPIKEGAKKHQKDDGKIKQDVENLPQRFAIALTLVKIDNK